MQTQKVQLDEVVEEVEKIEKEYEESYNQTLLHINSIQEFGKNDSTISKFQNPSSSLPRLNGLAQDGLNLLQSLQFKLDLLAPQLPSDQHVEKTQSLSESWKKQIQRAFVLLLSPSFLIICQSRLRGSLRNVNLQAKDNMRKAAKLERELLLGGGEESTTRRRNLQTKAGMTSAAESITDSLRRTRQLMVQEVERSASTLMTVEESTGVLKKAESEYKGHRSLLMRTRNLLSTMQRQDVLDRIIIAVGFIIFSLAVLYVVSKRIGLLKLQRTLMAAAKAGMGGQVEIIRRAVAKPPQVHVNVVHDLHAPFGQPMHDEL